MTIGARIKTARKMGKFTQAKLAEEIGVHEVTLRNWENGEKAPNSITLSKIANILKVPVIYLIGETGEDETLSEIEPIRGDRVRELREKLNFSQRGLAEFSGLPLIQIVEVELGKRGLYPMSIFPLASVLNTSIGYLTGETDDPAPPAVRKNEVDAPEPAQKRAVESNVAPLNPSHMIRVRVLDKFYHACCGTGIDWGGETVDFEETLLLPLPDLARRYGDDDVIGVYAEGDSMEDLICDGDLVLFVPHEKSVVYAGVPMVVSYNNSMIMRGVIENGSKKLTLRAASKEYRDIIVTPEDDFDICGRIVKVFSTREPRAVL